MTIKLNLSYRERNILSYTIYQRIDEMKRIADRIPNKEGLSNWMEEIKILQELYQRLDGEG